MCYLSTPLTTTALPLGNYIDNKRVKVKGKQFFYPFPPFGLIAKCLHKIQMDYAESFMIVPLWTTQCWYLKLLHMLEDVPRVIPSQWTALQMSGMKQEVHSFIKKIALIVYRLASSALRHNSFLRNLPLLSYSPGMSRSNRSALWSFFSVIGT